MRQGLMAFLAITLFLSLSSCDHFTDTGSDSGIEEIVTFLESTEPITGAQNVTMDLSDGHNEGAYFLIELSNIHDNAYITNGVKKGWCIEWDVSSIKEPQNNVKLHSTKNMTYWRNLNYLLNNIDLLKQQHPELSWKEIQVVVWSIVDYKPFDIDEVPEYSNFPSNFYKNGEYQFDADLAKEIIQYVRNNAKQMDGGSFAIIIENKGQILVTTSEQ